MDGDVLFRGNPRGDFIQPKDVVSENDRLVNLDVAADERNQTLAVTRNHKEGRNLRQIKNSFRRRFFDRGQNERKGGAGVSDPNTGEHDKKGGKEVAVLRSKTKVETKGKGWKGNLCH
jgi:hypothetical protein